MNYEKINELKAKKEKILKSEKTTFTRKDIGGLYVKPTEKRTITIQVKLPLYTNNDDDYIPVELLKQYYKKGSNVWGYTYSLKKNKQEEASKIRIPFEVTQYIYSKEEVLDRLNEVIEGYKEAIEYSCKVAKKNIKEIQKRLAKYEELLK